MCDLNLISCRLPLLRRFGYPLLDMSQATGFLKKHGGKLTSLAFREYASASTEQDASLAGWCPHVAEIEFWGVSASPAYFCRRFSSERSDKTPNPAVDHSGVLRVIVNTASVTDISVWLAVDDEDDGNLQGPALANLREVQNHALDDWCVIDAGE